MFLRVWLVTTTWSINFVNTENIQKNIAKILNQYYPSLHLRLSDRIIPAKSVRSAKVQLSPRITSAVLFTLRFDTPVPDSLT